MTAKGINDVKKGNARDIESVFEVVWPLGEKAMKTIKPVPRPATLEGKTIGELSNMLFHADVLFAELEKLLSTRYPGVRFVNYEEFGYTHGGQEEATIASLPAKLAYNRCDAVISAVGG